MYKFLVGEVECRRVTVAFVAAHAEYDASQACTKKRTKSKKPPHFVFVYFSFFLSVFLSVLVELRPKAFSGFERGFTEAEASLV